MDDWLTIKPSVRDKTKSTAFELSNSPVFGTKDDSRTLKEFQLSNSPLSSSLPILLNDKVEELDKNIKSLKVELDNLQSIIDTLLPLKKD